jgi:hypothetical protein
MQKLSLSIKNFNERVKVMNQTGSKQLSLSAEEARNLHADIFNLLTNVAESQTVQTSEPAVDSTGIDGGGFK